MNNPYFNPLRKLQEERRKKREKIKKDFVESGHADKMIKDFHERLEQGKTDIEDVPF